MRQKPKRCFGVFNSKIHKILPAKSLVICKGLFEIFELILRYDALAVTQFSVLAVTLNFSATQL